MPINPETQEYEAPDPGIPGQEVVTDIEQPVEEPDPRNDQIKSLAQMIENVNNNVKSTATNASLLTDPNIRKYLEAKQSGKAVKLMLEDEVPQQQQTQDDSEIQVPENIEEMTNAQLLEFSTKTSAKKLEKVMRDIITSQIGNLRNEIRPQLDGMIQSEENRMQENVKNQLTAARKEFKDFDAMSPLIAQVNKEFAGAAKAPSVKDLYYLAKIRSGQSLIGQEKIETERPDVPGTSRQGKVRQPSKETKGRNGFANILGSYLDSADLT